MNTPLLRIQKIIADAGVTSRRKAEELILQGRVQVNGETVSQLGAKANPSEDVVMVDGQIVDSQMVSKLYLVMNKPRGVITSVSDPQGRQTVIDLIPEINERVFPVGRLDYLSEGLLILTNDGELANQIIHPKYGIEKVYEVKVFGTVDATLLKKLRAGVEIEGRLAKPQSVRVVGQLYKKTWLEFRLVEGRNREIRRICEGHGVTIDKLRRVAIGGLSIQGIRPGSYHWMTKEELVKKLGVSRGQPKAYISQKRSMKVDGKLRIKKSEKSRQRKFRNEESLPADSEFFQIFRKGQYYKTLTENKPS